jgi:hypothetical protein
MKIQVLTSEYEYMGLPLGLVIHDSPSQVGERATFVYNGKVWHLEPYEYKVMESPTEQIDILKPVKQDALAVQIGGGHYKDFKIQPVEYIYANNIPFLEGNVIKYTSRHKSKNKAADIKKAIHCLELILQMEYGDE